MNKTNHVAFDLGASSGRMVLGEYHNKSLNLKEIYRFVNTPVEMNGILYWDFPKLYQEMFPNNSPTQPIRMTFLISSMIPLWELGQMGSEELPMQKGPLGISLVDRARNSLLLCKDMALTHAAQAEGPS